jgi:hypothetical protein
MGIKQPACQSLGRQSGVQSVDFLSHSVSPWRESAVLAAPGVDAGHGRHSMGTSTPEFHSRIGLPDDTRNGPIHALLLRPDAAHSK